MGLSDDVTISAGCRWLQHASTWLLLEPSVISCSLAAHHGVCVAVSLHGAKQSPLLQVLIAAFKSGMHTFR